MKQVAVKLKDNTIGSFDAKRHLSRLLQKVVKGQTITITRRGKPVARLVPVQEEDEMSIDHIINDLASIRKRIKGFIDVKELIREGRNY